jgi:hypothetical protein
MFRMRRSLPPLIICLFLAGLYLYTMPPGLTWAYDGADGGDLVTAAATGGVPHPTGYPTYLIAASVFLRIPIGSLAYRTNLLSTTCAVLAAWVVFLLMRSWDRGLFAAAVASLAFGTFPLVWSQAIITEVYALNALFAALLLYMCARDETNPRLLAAGGVIAGLALGGHLSIIFMLPLLFISSRGRPRLAASAEAEGRLPGAGRRVIGWRTLGLLMGLAVYAVIPLRARTQAPVNWGNAVNGEGLIWLVSGRAYWDRIGDFNASYLWTGIRAWSRLLLQQLGIVGLLLVAIVLAVRFRRSWMYLASAWLLFAYSAFAILFHSPDSYVYLIPALLALSIWMGLGADWIDEQVTSRLPTLRPLAIAVVLAGLALRAVLLVPSMSLSTDSRAEQYAQTVLASAPRGALIFARGDEATFSLWYFHYAYHERQDAAIISSDLLVQPWYRIVLRHTYPGLMVADDGLQPEISRDNPARPTCQAGPDLQAAVACSP